MSPSRTNSLTPASVLVHTPQCTVRPQRDHYLIYNARTDELHLVPPSGNYVYELCNGIATIADIERALVQATGRSLAIVRHQLTEFLAMLVDRGLLAIDEPAPSS